MIGVTAIPDQKIISFHQHTTGVTDTIESIAVIPGYLDDELWIVANRTIGASTKRYVERMHDQFYQGAIADAFFVDSGLSYSGAPAVTFYGMDHLEGETVQVLADGIYVGTEVIASGEFTIAVAASTVHAGIAYNSDIKTLPWELGRDGGSSDTTKKRIIGCNIKVYETSELQFGRDATHLMDIPMTDGTLYTDWIYREFNGDFLRNPTVYMRQNKPLPATILSIGADIDVGGK